MQLGPKLYQSFMVHILDPRIIVGGWIRFGQHTLPHVMTSGFIQLVYESYLHTLLNIEPKRTGLFGWRAAATV